MEHLERAKTGQCSALEIFWHGTFGVPHQPQLWSAPAGTLWTQRVFHGTLGAPQAANHGTLGSNDDCPAPDRPHAPLSGADRASKPGGRGCKHAPYLFVRQGWAIGAGSVLLGLTIATIFPTVLAEAGSWFPAYSGIVFSILIGVALTGGITLPWVTGRLSQRARIHIGLNLVILNAAGVWALQTLAGARMRLVPERAERA